MRPVQPLLVLATLVAVSCKSEPATSYCEAVCDYAVSCHESDRTIDGDARMADCIAATEATDDGCAKASSGEMSLANAKLLAPCVEAVEAAASAGECDPWTGRYDDIVSATPPKDCVTQGADAASTWSAARNATQETNDELCDRFANDYCSKAAGCIEDQIGAPIPDSVSAAMGGTPMELCLQRLDPVYTADCKANSLYQPTEKITDEPNAPREFSRDCLKDFSAMSCDAMFTNPSAMDPTCAGAFADNDQLVEVAGAMVTLASDVAAAVDMGTGTTTGTTSGTTTPP